MPAFIAVVAPSRSWLCPVCGIEWVITPAGAVFLTPEGPSEPQPPDVNGAWACCGERFVWERALFDDKMKRIVPESGL